jgi:cell division protein FtsZ
VGAAVGGSSLGSGGDSTAEVIGEIDIDELVETANWGEAPSAAADQIVSDPAFDDDGDDLDIPDFLK